MASDFKRFRLSNYFSLDPIKSTLRPVAVEYQRFNARLRFSNALLLFLLPLPVLLATVFALGRGDLLASIINGTAYALYLSGALLTRFGLRNAAIYERRKVARAPAYPLKLWGAVTTAFATGFTALFAANHRFSIAVGFALGAFFGCYLMYGFDPRSAKQAVDAQGIDTTDQVTRALQRAEAMLAAIEQASHRIKNPELTGRLRRITELARQILMDLEEDPRDLYRARKFLNVYLEGAQQVTQGYARTHSQADSEELEAKFRRVLITIEDVFQEQRQKLLEHDVVDLDVQIEVLSKQLKREGVV